MQFRFRKLVSSTVKEFRKMCSKVFDDYEDYLTNYLKDTPKLAILLDYDGTLTPIVQHPDMAVIPPETKEVLCALSQISLIFLGVISGRAVDNVKKMVGIGNITYAGNHGLEVLYPDGSSYKHQLPKNYVDQVKVVIQNLETKVVRDGAWIENKGASLTFHFRDVAEHLREKMEADAQKIIEEADFKVGKAHMALEARPKVNWHKGKVALLLLKQKYGDNWHEEAKVIFIGDDTTDEDAMESLKGKAATFRIAPNADINTHAEKLLSSTQHTLKILQLIQRLYKN